MTEAVKFNAISKSFGGTEVLRDLSFAIAPRERVALIGPSGSGKSTLLRMAVGLEFPNKGSVEVFGTKTMDGRTSRAVRRNLRKVRQHTGVVFQSYNLFPHMTVMANLIDAPVHVHKESRQEATDRAHDLLERVGLRSKADSRPSELSGGQQQRVALARALMTRPKLLLLDEVTSALDPELVGEVLDVIVNIAKEEDVAMLVVTHELRFAREIADTVYFLMDGEILESGPPSQILSDPANARTRKFVGL